MNDAAPSADARDPLERALREELARGNAILAATRPLLRHVLVNDDHELFSDAMIARLRGTALDIARQLVEAWSAAGGPVLGEDGLEHRERLAEVLFLDGELLGHLHALALEGQLAERLHDQCGLDPVLSPMIQDLAAVDDGAELSMAVLAAQARFMQYHRRMEVPLGELPGELFHHALLALRAYAGDADTSARAAEDALRAGYREDIGRLGLLSRLAARPGRPQAVRPGLDHAGLAIFASALAAAAGQDRELTVLAFADRQFARLALTLRAAGFAQQAIAAVFMFLHPDIALPASLDALSPARASELLGGTLMDAAF